MTRAAILLAGLLWATVAHAQPGPPPAPDGALAVSREDALRYENLVLKRLLLGADIDRARVQIQQREADLQAERDALDLDWQARYGLGLADTVQDGKTFRRRPSPPEGKTP